MARGIAALAVMLGHLRAMFFVEYSQLQHKTLPLQAAYGLTGLGHQAVVVFFVLSGLFIGPSVLEAVGRGRWSWKQYSVNRLSRLYVVLIPALLLTAGLDLMGRNLPGGSLSYRTPLPNYGTWTVMERETLPDFVGNLLSVESILCPPFGSNAPLWSLSFEFWYYILFPILVLACSRSLAWSKRTAWAACSLLVAWFIGRSLVSYFPVWLLGTLVACWYARRPGPSRYAWPLLAGSGLLLAATLGLARIGRLPEQVGDYLIAIATAVFFSALLRTDGSVVARVPGDLYTKAAHWIAGFSYSIYLAHLPVVVFLRATFITVDRWQPTPPHVILVAGLALLTLALCYLLSRVTEAQTAKVRRALR